MTTLHKRCADCNRMGSSYALYKLGKLRWYCAKCYHRQLDQRLAEKSNVVTK